MLLKNGLASATNLLPRKMAKWNLRKLLFLLAFSQEME